MSIYKLFSTTDGDGAASVDITAPGTIEGVYWSGYARLSADTDDFEAELSFASSSGFATNDTKSSICGIRQETELVTSGQITNGVNSFCGPLNVPVAQGERLYLHTATPAGTATMRISCWVYVRDRASQSRRVRL